MPLFTCETALCLDVGEWILGVNIFDLDFGVQIDFVKQPIQRNAVGAGHVSHRGTSAFDNNFVHCFIALKNVKQDAEVRKFCVCSNMFDIDQFKIISVGVFLLSGVGAFFLCAHYRTGFPGYKVGSKESVILQMTKSQRLRAGIPSMRKPASKKNNLRYTQVCFLHIQLVGTNVLKVPSNV